MEDTGILEDEIPLLCVVGMVIDMHVHAPRQHKGKLRSIRVGMQRERPVQLILGIDGGETSHEQVRIIKLEIWICILQINRFDNITSNPHLYADFEHIIA
jgi:hypothetical protein